MVCWLSAHVGFAPPENLANPADRDQYELLCRENTRRPVDEYKECHLARVPSHAIVARSVDGKEDLIWELLNQAQVSPPPVFPSFIRVPTWIWGAFPHSLLATVEILVLGTVGTTSHVLHFTDHWSGYVMGSSDHKTPSLGIPNTMGQRLCKRPLLPHSILLGCIGILKLQRCPSSRSCSPLLSHWPGPLSSRF